MIHPDSEIKFINDQIGFGVFATSLIPKGTIVYAKDPFEIEVSKEEFKNLHPVLKEPIEKYSYIDEIGKRIVSWDIAKYVNHCCHSNTISTGYGFEIARRDILPGEEITDDYGLFNLENTMELSCNQKGCRGKVQATDLDLYYQDWDKEIIGLLKLIDQLDQPLWTLLPLDKQEQLVDFLNGNEKGYISVQQLRYQEENINISLQGTV